MPKKPPFPLRNNVVYLDDVRLMKQCRAELTELNDDIPEPFKPKGPTPFKPPPTALPKEKRKDLFAIVTAAFQLKRDDPWTQVPLNKHEGATPLAYNAPGSDHKKDLTFSKDYDTGLRGTDHGRMLIFDVDGTSRSIRKNFERFLKTTRSNKKGFTGRNYWKYKNPHNRHYHYIVFLGSEVPYSRTPYIQRAIRELLGTQNIEVFPKERSAIRFAPTSSVYEFVSGPKERVFLNVKHLSEKLGIDVTGRSLPTEQKTENLIRNFKNEMMQKENIPEDLVDEKFKDYIKDIASQSDLKNTYRANEANRVLDFLNSKVVRLSNKKRPSLNLYDGTGTIGHGTRHTVQVSHIAMAQNRGWTIGKAVADWKAILHRSNNRTNWKHAKKDYVTAWKWAERQGKRMLLHKRKDKDTLLNDAMAAIYYQTTSNQQISKSIINYITTEEVPLRIRNFLLTAILVIPGLSPDPTGALHIPVSLWINCFSKDSYIEGQAILASLGILVRLDQDGYHYNPVQRGRGQCYKFESKFTHKGINRYQSIIHPHFSVIVTSFIGIEIVHAAMCEFRDENGLLQRRARGGIEKHWTPIGPSKFIIVSTHLNDTALASI